MKKLLLIFALAGTFTITHAATINAVTEVKTAEEYETIVANSATPVVIDFFAKWCGPCKRMKTIFEKVSGEFVNTVKFVKIDIDTPDQKLQIIIDSYNVRSIPTFVFKKGLSTSQRVGLMSERELRIATQNLLSV